MQVTCTAMQTMEKADLHSTADRPPSCLKGLPNLKAVTACSHPPSPTNFLSRYHRHEAKSQSYCVAFYLSIGSVFPKDDFINESITFVDTDTNKQGVPHGGDSNGRRRKGSWEECKHKLCTKTPSNNLPGLALHEKITLSSKFVVFTRHGPHTPTTSALRSSGRRTAMSLKLPWATQ